jgi:UDP-N-acetyl-D-mannosaminuronic acid dehydrogenase
MCDEKVGFPLFDFEKVIMESDILVVLVDHSEFKSVDRELLKEKVVVDTRGIWK